MILVINPGSTSTKLALFAGGQSVAAEEIQHQPGDLARFERVVDQFDFRIHAVRDFLEKAPNGAGSLRAVVGRGGLLRPLEGGVYEVSDEMIDDLQQARYGEHPCNLGAILARKLATEHDVPAYVVDPVVTDELMDEARITGLPSIERRSLFHALNQRGAARLVADRLGVEYEKSNFIVCHMGGGISIGAHRKGRVVDVLNGLDGEGPFTPERTGALPVLPILDLLRSGEMDIDQLARIVTKQGGLLAHLGTNDPREIVARMDDGDEKARRVFEGLAYCIARHVASMTPALVDEQGALSVAAVILTGGMARSDRLVGSVTRMVAHIAPVEVLPGEVEMASLAAGAERALSGEMVIRSYESAG